MQIWRFGNGTWLALLIYESPDNATEKRACFAPQAGPCCFAGETFMKMRLHGAVCLIALLVLLPLGSLAAPVTPDMRAKDKKLETPVTFASPRIAMGELLERLSTLSGVALTMDNRVAASGVSLCLSVKQMPLADVMNALWSVVSLQKTAWRWEKTEEAKTAAPRYWLISGEPNGLHARIQDAYEKQVALLVQAANASPDERKKWLGKNKADDEWLTDDTALRGIKLFAEAVPSGKRKPVLRGQESIDVPVSNLSAEAQKFVASENAQTPGKPITNENVQIYVNAFPGEIAPTLWIQINGSGHSYAGGGPLNAQFLSEIEEGWIHAGDTTDSPLTTRTVVKPADYKPVYASPVTDLESLRNLTPQEGANLARFQNELVPTRLSQLAGGVPLSFVAVLPPATNAQLTHISSGEFYEEPYGKTVAQYLRLLHKEPKRLMTKWRGDLLLVNQREWFLSDDDSVPWDAIKRLRQLVQKRRGLLTLQDLCDVASQVSQTQMGRMDQEYPSMDTIARWHNFLAVGARFRETRMGQGCLLTEEMRQMFRTLPDDVPGGLARAHTIRLWEQPSETPDRPGMTFFFEMRDDKGKLLHRNGFTCFALKPAKPMAASQP